MESICALLGTWPDDDRICSKIVVLVVPFVMPDSITDRITIPDLPCIGIASPKNPSCGVSSGIRPNDSSVNSFTLKSPGRNRNRPMPTFDALFGRIESPCSKITICEYCTPRASTTVATTTTCHPLRRPITCCARTISLG